MKLRLLIWIGYFFLSVQGAHAIEGMWLPQLLKEVNEKEMKSLGMRISAEDIYNINRSSMKDAVFLFGGGCTAELVSSKGLLLTNHHCGFGQIQSHTSLEHDYLKYGFWAADNKAELPNKGLTATRIVRIEDVTQAVLSNAIKDDGTIDPTILDANIQVLSRQAVTGTHYEAVVKSFYYGNQYYLFITETFKDVRLVGAPPSSVGNYGRDTDNWMWPRHNADFSVFRIYAGKDNKPAEYSEDNVPYQPGHFFPVSLKGVKEGDFTMVYGFPGRTQEYLPSYAVDMVMNHLNPMRIEIRSKSLEIIHQAMAESDALRIKYAAKSARISNAWKKWIGESNGLKKLDALEVKKLWEKKYTEAVNGKEPYASVLKDFQGVYAQFQPAGMANDYYIELLSSGAEVFRFAYNFVTLSAKYKEYTEKGELTAQVDRLKKGTESFFKNYDVTIDKKIMKAVLPVFVKGIDPKKAPALLIKKLEAHRYDYNAFTEELYSGSVFTDQARTLAWLDEFAKDPAKTIKKTRKDQVFSITANVYDTYQSLVEPEYSQLNAKIQDMMRVYMKGILTYLPDEKRYYPDANSTLRVTYGKVEGYRPKDGVKYDYYTTIEGVMQKYVPGDDEFDLLPKFMELYQKRDFGRYGEDGTLRVAFTASNHTTGGNSGSPVLNADGELVGINFDRAWESTMSDIMYDPERCRNIIVDIRYVLWVIDKYAGAGHLVDEMKIVE